jgi:hypothetical protein
MASLLAVWISAETPLESDGSPQRRPIEISVSQAEMEI